MLQDQCFAQLGLRNYLSAKELNFSAKKLTIYLRKHENHARNEEEKVKGMDMS